MAIELTCSDLKGRETLPALLEEHRMVYLTYRPLGFLRFLWIDPLNSFVVDFVTHLECKVQAIGESAEEPQFRQFFHKKDLAMAVDTFTLRAQSNNPRKLPKVEGVPDFLLPHHDPLTCQACGNLTTRGKQVQRKNIREHPRTGIAFDRPGYEIVEELREELIKLREKVSEFRMAHDQGPVLIDVEGLLGCGVQSLYRAVAEMKRRERVGSAPTKAS